MNSKNRKLIWCQRTGVSYSTDITTTAAAAAAAATATTTTTTTTTTTMDEEHFNKINK